VEFLKSSLSRSHDAADFNSLAAAGIETRRAGLLDGITQFRPLTSKRMT
jgi:hypothetical protein